MKKIFFGIIAVIVIVLLISVITPPVPTQVEEEATATTTPPTATSTPSTPIVTPTTPKLPAGSTPPGDSALIMDDTWIWTGTFMNDGTTITPKKADAFTVTLNKDGNATGTTDCNSFFSAYQVGSDGILSFGPIGSTKMFCEGAQEGEFLRDLGNISSYSLSPQGNLVLELKFDSGSMSFKKKR